MLKSYILIAIRQFVRHKMFSALNVFCLAIGISFCLLMGQYILHESSVNENLKNVHQQYFLTSNWKIKNTGPEIATVGPLARSLKISYPGLVSNYYRFNPVTTVVSAGDKHFREDVAIGDTSFISMYGHPLLYGDPSHAFLNNTSALITEELALKLFGGKNAINKTVTMTNNTGTTRDYQVTAVLKSMKYNSINNLLADKGYSMFVPFEGNDFYPLGGDHGGTGEEDWNQFYTVGYIELQPHVKPDQLDAPVKKLLALNCPESISKNLEVQFKPLDSYYLKANNGAIAKTLSILLLVALSILLLAIINFVNIMIGTSAYRIKEIGLRKVFGGRRKQLISQYMIESILFTALAAILSLLFYGLFRPLFNEVLNTSLPSLFSFHAKEITLLLLLVLVVGSVAGSYPALILSKAEMIASVKGNLGSVDKGAWMRKSLLVAQFMVTIVVFIFSTTISKQVRFFFDVDLGFNKDQLLVISAFPKQWDAAGVVKMESIRNALLGLKEVKEASVSFEVPERTPPFLEPVIPEASKSNKPVSIQSITVDENYASTFGLHLLQGRFFRKNMAGYTPGETVINESALKSFGWNGPIAGAIGKRLYVENLRSELTVVGVVKDFHLASLHENIGPLSLTHVKDAKTYRYLTLKLKPGNLSEEIAQVRDKWKQVSPSAPFDYFFMDEKVQSMYESELQLKKAASFGTGMMLLIVLLGIFGVVTLALTKRVKEIAVRRVLGAELHHILSLFIRQYLGLLFLANIIAWPLTYYFCNRWLQQFAYRIIQSVSTYLMAGLFLSVIALVLISLQCLKAALANPVSNLHVE
jgi:putative ABC transport system permease protein